jgi:hypothetical protein
LTKATKKVGESEVGTQTISATEAAGLTPKQVAESQLLGTELPKKKEEFAVPSYQSEQQPIQQADPYASIRQVFGTAWQPSAIFTQKGLTSKGIYGAVRVARTPEVYTIGPGGTKETAETYLQKFGSAEQKGIVGEVSAEQAKKLGIKL